MNLTKKAIIFLSFVLFFVFCTKESETDYSSNKYAEKKGSIAFLEGVNLKPDTLFDYNAVSNYFYFGGLEKGEIVVKVRDMIYEFDESSGNVVKKWTFPIEGPNRVKGVHKLDCIIKFNEENYLMTHHMTGEIYQLNEKGAKVQFQLDYSGDQIRTFYNSSIVFPILNALDSNEVILPLMNHGRSKKLSTAYAFARFNILNEKFDEIINYPNIYDDYHWGDHPYAYTANIQYVPKKQKYFVSFPIDPNIYIYNETFKYIGKQLVRSEYISSIEPFRKEKLSMDDIIDYAEDRKYLRGMSFYMGAYYDPSTELYYRMVRRAIKNDSDGHDYQYSFIICNLDLEIIDELTIDSDRYNIFQTFVCSKGLMLLNESKMVDESELPFDRLAVEYPL